MPDNNNEFYLCYYKGEESERHLFSVRSEVEAENWKSISKLCIAVKMTYDQLDLIGEKQNATSFL